MRFPSSRPEREARSGEAFCPRYAAYRGEKVSPLGAELAPSEVEGALGRDDGNYYALALVGEAEAVVVGGHRGAHQFRLQDVERAGVDLLRLSRWQRDRIARLLLVVPEQLLHIVLAAELPEGLHEVGLAAHEMSRGDRGAASERPPAHVLLEEDLLSLDQLVVEFLQGEPG